MNNNKIIAMMMTLSMLAAAFAGCLGGDDDDNEEWALNVASDVDSAIVSTSWDSILGSMATNSLDTCDAIISSVTITEERDAKIDFTTAYYSSSQGVIGGPGVATISQVSELNVEGTTLIVQQGTTSDLYAAANLPLATVVGLEDFDSVFTALENGDGHYALGDAAVLALKASQTDSFSPLMVTFSSENFGIAIVDDADNELEDALNVAITAIIASGEYDAHIEAWFPGTSGTLQDTTTAATATAYPTPTDKSALTVVLESGTLRFCSDTSYAPFEYTNNDGSYAGFSIDIASAITDEIAEHYSGVADATVLGCTNMDATNYDATATLDDATCIVEVDTIIRIGFLNDATGPISVYAGGFTFASTTAATTLTAANDGYTFEIVEADSACDGQAAATAAQTLIDAGVVAVAGAACSGASIAANAVLSAVGIPMVSYASTSPALSDSTAHPDFYRLVPSDAIQGAALVDMVAARGVTSPALIHMTNAYGAGLADAFEDSWIDNGNTLCTKLGYEDTATDFSASVQAVMDAGCDSAVLASYSADGAMIIETMAVLGAEIPIFGADGIAGESALNDYSDATAANGVQVTTPRAAGGSGTFSDICDADEVCGSGIYTLEAYDSVMMIGHAAMMEDGANMAAHLDMVGVDYNGESGVLTFLDNGDIPATRGYDVCTFNYVPTYGDYYNCDMMWTPADGLAAAPFMGATVKIGFLNDATGPIAVYAMGFVTASQIALKMANTIGWNSMVQFEIVYADSGCSGDMGASAAQTLVDAGVVGVVGAACSGASMAANAVLSAAGIPQISYASTSPALSDATAYPDFFRLVPSDALQGQALSAVVQADMPVDGTVGLVHMTNAYGSGLAEAFAADFAAAGYNLCTTIGYEETTTDFSATVQGMMDEGCTSAVLVSYAADGGMILDEMASKGWSGQVYGGDGIAEEGLAADTSASVDGVIAIKPASESMGTVGYVFASLCAQSSDCAGGIYTAQAFDGVVVMALSAFAQMASPGATLSQVIMGTGQGLEGASGIITFVANGDLTYHDSPGAGYCVGDFTEDADGNAAFTCNRHWTLANGIA